MTEPRYTEDQFAEILRRATEMQARLPARTGDSRAADGDSGAGMSLADIRAIAAEVGIDPELVDRAATLVPHGSRPEGGLGARWVLDTSSPGQLTDEDKLRLVRAIRDATESHGDADTTGVGLEWKSQSGDGSVVLVTAEPLDGRNELRVSVDASVPALMSQFFPTLVGGVVGMAIGASVEPGLAGGIALVASTGGAGFMAGRLLWKRLRANAVARSRKILAAAAAALPSSKAAPHD